MNFHEVDTEISPFYIQQTNTADMLEEAVEYVKFLQQKIQVWILKFSLITMHLHRAEDTKWKFGI